MIIATPLDLPKLEPDNWDVFWDIWNTNSAPLHKKYMNHFTSKTTIGSSDIWSGIDIYKSNINVSTAWEAPYVNIENDLPTMFNIIKNLPFKLIYKVRIIQSLKDIGPHTDNGKDSWSIRAFLKYDDPSPQWYFTKSNNRDGNRSYLRMPKDTNWFAYNDKYCWHGTTYNPDYPKLLIQIYSLDNNPNIIGQSTTKYKDYTIDIES